MSSGFVGTWEVTKYEPCQDSNYIKGIRFRLDSNGDVTWFVPEELKSVPLFNCEIYDTSASLYSAQESTCLRFGEYAGHVIEFKSDQRKPKDTVILSSESFLYTLHCKRVPEEVSEDNYQVPFSLLTALEEGYFSDLVITSKNEKQFHTHSLVLKIVGPDIDWHSSVHPLSNLLEEVLGTILHYMYTECLPENLSEATAQRVIMAITDLQFLNKLITMCKMYLRNIALKKQIIGLVNDMHDCLDKLINHLGEKRSSASDSLISNPDQLCFVVKQCFRDAAVAVVKVIELCDLYSKKKPELTKNEQHEIIRYGKSRFHIFLAQIQRFLQLLKDTFGSMSPYQKTDVAIFLVPEVTGILYMLTQLMIQIEGAIESIIAVLNPDDLCKSKSSFGNACTSFLYTKEVKKLRQFSELVACSLDILDRKRQSFMEMTNAQKVRSIFRNIEQSIDEIPLLFLIRLEEVTESSDKGLGWRDFKFCFQVGTSKISNVVQLMATHREEIQEVALQVCELVQRDAFNRSLQNMGILEPAAGSSQEEPEEKSAGHSTQFQNYTHKMNLVESFCTSPKAAVSVLSRNLLDQFRKSCNTDMEFEIDNSADVDSSSEEVESPTAKQSCVINAHRVVVASRCDWFRKALLSGMREDIDKKIVIHDTNPTMFKIFLEYLYTGSLSPSLLTNEQLVDLLVLSDRFEVETLKQACETALESTVDAENAIYLLSLADNYNAISLRNYCLDFIAQHQELTESDVFCELQSDLQAVIFDHIWTQPLPKKSSSKHDRHSSGVTTSDIERHFAAMNLHQDTGASVQHDLNRLERCISQIRYVIGDDATREQLVQVILAADFDLCRAINYYYSKNN
ncbi:hypothetical protein WA026_021382 [Henosepilachna vigintioctopunctata]|uniref:BTB domain-containing protein n=1 Tax=Henosepilachna vigintioctopunctata TaxID=420089 RepID=A0AAW1U1A4_9CUCU